MASYWMKFKIFMRFESRHLEKLSNISNGNEKRNIIVKLSHFSFTQIFQLLIYRSNLFIKCIFEIFAAFFFWRNYKIFSPISSGRISALIIFVRSIVFPRGAANTVTLCWKLRFIYWCLKKFTYTSTSNFFFFLA